MLASLQLNNTKQQQRLNKLIRYKIRSVSNNTFPNFCDRMTTRQFNCAHVLSNVITLLEHYNHNLLVYKTVTKTETLCTAAHEHSYLVFYTKNYSKRGRTNNKIILKVTRWNANLHNTTLPDGACYATILSVKACVQHVSVRFMAPPIIQVVETLCFHFSDCPSIYLYVRLTSIHDI